MVHPRHLAVLIPGPGNLLAWWALSRSRRHRRSIEGELGRWHNPLEGLERPGRGGGAIILLGASITEGFPVKRLLPEWPLVPGGRGGLSAGQLLLAFRHQVLERRPAAVVIKLCSLNFEASYHGGIIRDALLSMVDLSRVHGIRPLLATVVPVGQGIEREEPGMTGRILSFNREIGEVARERDLALVDYHGVLADPEGFLPPSLGPDGVHPSEEGYRLMARVLEEVLSRDLGEFRGGG